MFVSSSYGNLNLAIERDVDQDIGKQCLPICLTQFW